MNSHPVFRVLIDESGPHTDLLSDFLFAPLPGPDALAGATVVERIVEALIGSGQIRLGPRPNLQGLATIENVVRRAVDRSLAIPVLVPWGSKKPRNGDSVDVAEVCALKQLAGLQDRIRRHYGPGLDLIIRVEDASGYYLFADEVNSGGCRFSIDQYCSDFRSLVKILGLNFTRTVFESELFSESRYTTLTDSVVPVMEAYLTETDLNGFHSDQARVCWRHLHHLTGIRGEIAMEQREFYRVQYRKMFPALDAAQVTRKLARYLGGVLVRNRIGGRGDDIIWQGQYIQLTFHAAIPGAPPETIQHYIRYRTVPTCLATTHVPPWRAKGYLKVLAGQLVPKIVGYNDIPAGLHPGSVRLVHGDHTVRVTTETLIR